MGGGAPGGARSEHLYRLFLRTGTSQVHAKHGRCGRVCFSLSPAERLNGLRGLHKRFRRPLTSVPQTRSDTRPPNAPDTLGKRDHCHSGPRGIVPVSSGGLSESARRSPSHPGDLLFGAMWGRAKLHLSHSGSPGARAWNWRRLVAQGVHMDRDPRGPSAQAGDTTRGARSRPASTRYGPDRRFSAMRRPDGSSPLLRLPLPSSRRPLGPSRPRPPRAPSRAGAGCCSSRR